MPGLLYSVPLTPRKATIYPCLQWRLLDTHRQVWLSLLWGHCSSLWVCLLGGSMVGLTSQASQVCCCQSPCPRSRPPLTCASTGDTQTLKGKSGSVSCGVTAPFSWVLVHTRFCLYPPRVCFPRVLGDALYGSYVSLVNFKVLQRKGMEFYVNKEILSWAVRAGIP